MISFDKTTFVKIVAILDAIPDPMVYESTEGVYLYGNNAFFSFTGMNPEDILGKSHTDVSPLSTAELYKKTDEIVIQTKRPYSFEHIYDNHHGEPHHFMITKSPHLNAAGEVIGVIILMEDITDKKAAEKEVQMLHQLKDTFLELSHAMVDFTSEESMLKLLLHKVMSIYDVCEQGSVLEISDNETLTVLAYEGFQDEDMKNFKLPLKGSFIWQDVPGEISSAHVVNDISAYIAQGFPDVSLPVTGNPVQSALIVPVFIDSNLKWIFSLDSAYNHIYTETDRKVADYIREELPLIYNLFDLYQKTLKMSRYDALTKLQNRHYFDQVHEALYNIIRENGQTYTLGLFDLDGLKIINDLHGHQAGDTYLITFSEFLINRFKDAKHIARIGGDEFAVLFETADIEALCLSIETERGCFEQMKIENDISSFRGSFSFGVANYPNDSEDRSRLFQIADTRLYKDKKRTSRRHTHETHQRS